jgi:hypothetical protein
MSLFKSTILKISILFAMGLGVQSLSAITVRVKLASGLNWNNVYIYNYINAAPAEGGNWPGKQLVANAEGWYSYTFTGEPGGVIFNNNAASQFDAPEISADVCFEISSQGISPVDCPTNIPDPEAIVIRWKQVSGGWAEMAIYAWGGSPVSDTFGDWPGQVVTADAEGWYSVTVPAGQTVGHVIFNNTRGADDGGEQFDADIVTTTTACYEITNTSATKVDCPSPITAIALPEKQQQWTISPNPAASLITLASVEDIRSIAVINASGKTVLQPPVKKDVDIQQLPSGVYFLKIQPKTSNIQYVKFIKK